MEKGEQQERSEMECDLEQALVILSEIRENSKQDHTLALLPRQRS